MSNFNEIALRQAEEELKKIEEKIDNANRTHEELMEPLYEEKDNILKNIQFRKDLLSNSTDVLK